MSPEPKRSAWFRASDAVLDVQFRRFLRTVAPSLDLCAFGVPRKQGVQVRTECESKSQRKFRRIEGVDLMPRMLGGSAQSSCG